MKSKLLAVLFLGATLLPLSACGSSETTPVESPVVPPAAESPAMSPPVSPAPGATSPVPTTSP